MTSDQVSRRVKLEFVEPVIKHGTAMAVVNKKDMAPDYEKWENTLVGYVLGTVDPSHSSMEEFLYKNWRKFGNVELLSLESGVFIFVFQTNECREQILDEAPWFFELQPIILKMWTPNIRYRKDLSLQSAPIWIKLYNLPIHLRSPVIFSKIASLVGKPLFTEKSVTCERLSFPSICVEVDAELELPRYVLVGGTAVTVRAYFVKIEYVRMPPKCSSCKRFGHSVNICDKK